MTSNRAPLRRLLLLGLMLAGLVVVQMDGTRITWRQAIVRTLFRGIEVNPLLLGALPAALCIIISRYRQRIGDKVAGTVVVSKKHLLPRVRTAFP